MSFHFPRRVKDLPKLELDSEDEINTPCKAKNNINAILEEKYVFSLLYMYVEIKNILNEI